MKKNKVNIVTLAFIIVTLAFIGMKIVSHVKVASYLASLERDGAFIMYLHAPDELTPFLYFIDYSWIGCIALTITGAFLWIRWLKETT